MLRRTANGAFGENTEYCDATPLPSGGCLMPPLVSSDSGKFDAEENQYRYFVPDFGALYIVSPDAWKAIYPFYFFLCLDMRFVSAEPCHLSNEEEWFLAWHAANDLCRPLPEGESDSWTDDEDSEDDE